MGKIQEYGNAVHGKKERKIVKVQIVEKFAGWLEENKGRAVGEATRGDVREWIEGLKSKGRKISTLNQYISILRGFYGWWLESVPIPKAPDKLKKVCMMMKRFYQITQMAWIS